MFGREGRAAGAWLVTGAASGFGREMARRLDRRGEAMALWDRDGEGLERTREGLSGGRVHSETVDVTDPEAVEAALARSVAALGPIRHVFHSAGILVVGPAIEVRAPDYRRLMEVNYLGSVHVAQAALRHVQATADDRPGEATITFVASVAGLRAFPQLAGYAASKFAVVGFAQALEDELAGQPVRVKVLCPPPGDTPMVRDIEQLPPIYRLSPLFSAREVIDAYFDGLRRPGLLILVDVRSKALWRVSRFAPDLLNWIVRAAR